MLREVAHVYQIPGEPARRVFADEDTNLLIWYEADHALHGFQFTYGQSADDPHVLTWTLTRGFHHAQLDDGESSPLANRTPILVPNGPCDPAKIQHLFQQVSETLPQPERDFVRGKLEELAAQKICE